MWNSTIKAYKWKMVLGGRIAEPWQLFLVNKLEYQVPYSVSVMDVVPEI